MYLRPPSKKLLTSAIFFLIFGVSVLVRLPLLNQPLSHYRESHSATVLRHLQIWHEEGIAHAKFAPIMTYSGRADKNINNQASELADHEGNYFYISYPPLGYYVPYALFEALHIYPDVFPLQVFSLALHFLSGLFIYLAVKLILTSEYDDVCVPALIGFAAYIFSGETLWFQSNVYMTDMFAQFLLTVGIYLLLSWTKKQNSGTCWYILFGLLIFFFVYTEWLGVMFSFSVAVYAWLNRTHRVTTHLQLATLIGAASALGFTVWQYSRLSGLGVFLSALGRKFLLRSGFGDQAGLRFHMWDLHGWLFISYYYIQGYAAIFALLIFWGILNPKGRLFPEGGKMKMAFLFGAVMPPIMHHFLLFNFTSEHDFSVLKSAPCLAILAGAFASRLLTHDSQGSPHIFLRIFVPASLVLACVMGVWQYRRLIGPEIPAFREIGECVAKNARPDEIVFMEYENPTARWIETFTGPSPQTVLYAHRNIAVWENESEARKLAVQNHISRMVVFVVDSEKDAVVEIRRIIL